MSKKLYHNFGGIKLLALPITKSDRVNQKRKNIQDIGQTTASHMIHITGIRLDYPMLICGRYRKTFPVLRQLIKMSRKPFVLMGTKRDLEATCLSSLDTKWNADIPPLLLQQESGKITIKPGLESELMLKEYISNWNTHLLILCIGNGLQIDGEMLNALNSQGEYILLSEAVSRSIKECESNRLTVTRLFLSMDYLVISSIGSSAKELISTLPVYECEKVTNTTDFSFHKDSPRTDMNEHHHRNGSGLRISQSRTTEEKSILTQDDLTYMQENHVMAIYNARTTHLFTAKIVG